MASALTEKLSRLVKEMRGQARITESNVTDMLREVRMALLEADVALPVVRDFIARVKEKARGEEVVGSLTPGQVYFAGFDMSPNTAQAVKEGFQNLVIDQQPFLQGYIPILNICLTKKFGFSGLDIKTAGAFVDSTNVDAVAPLAAVEIR